MLNRIQTTTCKLYGHNEFATFVDSDVLQEDVAIFLSWLESTVKSGVQYKDGETIAIGIMLLMLSQKDDVLLIQEPDFCVVPIEWVEDISRTMRILRIEKDTSGSVGLGDSMDFPSILYGIWVGADLPCGSNHFFMSRTDHHASDSGWFVGHLDSDLDYNQPGTVRCISVYQALIDWPNIVYFLALPDGSHIEVTPEGVEIYFDEVKMAITEGSFLYSALPKIVGTN